MLQRLEATFRRVLPRVQFCSLRYYHERRETVSVRQDVPEPVERAEDAGVMITVLHEGGIGYAATSDISQAGLQEAIGRATLWASRSAGRAVFDFRQLVMPRPVGQYLGPNELPWTCFSLADRIAMLVTLCRQLRTSARIVDWVASVWHSDIETLYLTSAGGRAYQQIHLTGPELRATAAQNGLSQTRTFGGHAHCQQGGLEVLDRVGFHSAPARVADEALQLLAAPDCPSARLDLLLDPDQMILQIHESIGHPLELDRILGDERNYAATSFVTLDMIGSYRYGSELLNVTFDPTRPEQLASYAFDDEGARAEKVHIIRNGILRSALGGTVSRARSGLPGLGNARADTWNRPPIDRMANLNLEPGECSLQQMISSVQRGIYMKTNNSWSIDDSRNKFQFGCEWGQLIEDGQLTRVVKNPNYRGLSAIFWRNLKAVGNPDTFQVLGTPNCGKGEPNQIIFVAHATPACLFADVDVFGGA